MTKKLTDRQKEYLQVIRSLKKKNGKFPSIKEVAEKMGVSSTYSVREVFASLIKKKKLKRVIRIRLARYLGYDLI